VTESGGEYYADQVFLHAREGEVGRTLRFLDSYGWEVIGQSEFDETSIVIRVPLGGAPDIARFLSEQPFIEQASPHGILRTQ
jgi:hypothetical protein